MASALSAGGKLSEAQKGKGTNAAESTKLVAAAKRKGAKGAA